MRTLMPITPLTSSSTCTQRRAKASLTAVRTSSDTCSRSVHAAKPPFPMLLMYYNWIDAKPICPSLSTGWHSNTLRQKLWHKDGCQDRSVADRQTQGVLQTRYVQISFCCTYSNMKCTCTLLSFSILLLLLFI